MAIIGQESGCKVGWLYFDDEAEARAQAEREAVSRERMFGQGYDFGYQWPGAVEKINHPKYGECWKLVTT